jgi:hypothetical protein
MRTTSMGLRRFHGQIFPQRRKIEELVHQAAQVPLSDRGQIECLQPTV